MAFTRFTLADLAATIVLPEDSLCTALRKVMKAQRFAYEYMNYKYDAEGDITEAYCAEIKVCLANVPTT